MNINRLDGLTIRDLRALVLLADIGNFHRAASACAVSQPAFSSIIKKVEHTLDSKLFERNSRSCRTTSEGRVVVEKARGVLVALGKLNTQSELRPPLTGNFRVGFIPTIGPYLIPKLLRPLLRAYPQLELAFSEARTDALTQMLVDRSLDAAFVALPVPHARIKETPLFQEELLLGLSTEHRLAQRKRVAISELKEDELLVMEQGHCLRKQTLESCGSSAREAKTVHSTSLETLLYMVASGVGYAVVPHMAVSEKRSRDGVAFLHFKNPAPSRTIGLICLRGGGSEHDVEALAAWINASSEKLGF
ncbi:MAG: LysR family transcriptional regulator [Deltaproteobacteria bacterium]|nr:LysR family transcriptional regulator [Deltaproteobacteria bacterium]